MNKPDYHAQIARILTREIPATKAQKILVYAFIIGIAGLMIFRIVEPGLKAQPAVEIGSGPETVKRAQNWTGLSTEVVRYVVVDRGTFKIQTGYRFASESAAFTEKQFCVADAFDDDGVRVVMPIAVKNGRDPIEMAPIEIEPYRNTPLLGLLESDPASFFANCVFAENEAEISKIFKGGAA